MSEGERAWTLFVVLLLTLFVVSSATVVGYRVADKYIDQGWDHEHIHSHTDHIHPEHEHIHDHVIHDHVPEHSHPTYTHPHDPVEHDHIIKDHFHESGRAIEGEITGYDIEYDWTQLPDTIDQGLLCDRSVTDDLIGASGFPGCCTPPITGDGIVDGFEFYSDD